MPLIVSQKQAAVVLGITTRQLRNLDEDKDPVPSRVAKDGRGREYDLEEVVPWALRRERARGRTGESDLDRAKLEKERLEVRRRQIDIAKAESELVSVSDHRGALAKVLDAFRAALISVPGSWGPRIVGISSPAEGTEAMKVCSEELLRDLVAASNQLDMDESAEPIPDDFPGRRALAAAGVSTFAELRGLDDVTQIKGIGPKLAERIGDELESAA